jgi:membrane-associated protease RseP (regulator of RpoE activity)
LYRLEKPCFVEPTTSRLRFRRARTTRWQDGSADPERPRDRYWLHLLLFVLTLAATVHSGGILAGRLLRYEALEAWWFVPDGLRFALSLLLFLTVHEFGHYFAARWHRVDTSLPYYIPLPLIGFGTLGAVIRIREPIPSTRKLFDIGAAGPVAGFVVALGLLLFALATLPSPSYVLDLPGHEALKEYVMQHGRFPEAMPQPDPSLEGGVFVVGNTPLYWLLTRLFADVPPMYEMYHYPVLFAGWLGLFFTALNLLPVGQLDGGHILYTLVGPRWHMRIARGFVVLLLLSGAIGYVSEVRPWLYRTYPLMGELSWFILAGILYFYLHRVFQGNLRHVLLSIGGLMLLVVLVEAIGEPLTQFGYTGWFIWCLLVVFVIRIEHPPVLYAEPLTPRRRLLGVLSLVIFILCFSFKPLYML